MANIASTGSGNQSITYYALPNKTIDGSSLSSNIQDIVGGGGDVINLASGQQYFPNVGNDTVNGSSNGWNYISLWDGATGNITIDFTKGVMSPNGFGGVDTFTNITGVNDGGGINLNIIGNNKNLSFTLGNSNATVNGGTGLDTVAFYGQKSSNFKISILSGNSYSIANTQNGTVDNLTNIPALIFSDEIIDTSSLSSQKNIFLLS